MSEELLSKITGAILKAKKIGIAIHVKPDGDTLGSGLAFYKAFKKLGKDVCLFFEGDIPSIYKFLSCYEEVFESDLNKKRILSFMPELLLVVDTASAERMPKEAQKFLELKDVVVINIDHHKDNTSFGDINLIDKGASSTAEVSFKILKDLNVIDKDIAEAIYVGILTDTGRFSFSNVTPQTHVVVSELISYGIDVENITRNIYETKRLSMLKLWGRVWSELEFKKPIVIGKITKKIFSDTQATLADTEGLVESLLQVEGSLISVLFVEMEDFIRVSMRSRCGVDVSEIAKEWNGGGHKKAAACRLKGFLLEEAVDVITKALEEKLTLCGA